MNDFLSMAKSLMEKSLDFLDEEYKLIKVGRANPKILDRVCIDYYETKTPINQVASISVDARSLIIKPWDSSLLKEIEKSIQKEDLGVTPHNDGENIRINFPPLNEEARLKASKQVSKLAEDCKVAVRNVRRDIKSKVDAAVKSKKITEDESNRIEKKLQDLTDSHNKQIENMKSSKIKEVMEV